MTATKTAIKNLRLRIATYRAELATCSTAAARRCVLESLEIVCGQLTMAERSRER